MAWAVCLAEYILVRCVADPTDRIIKTGRLERVSNCRFPWVKRRNFHPYTLMWGRFIESNQIT